MSDSAGRTHPAALASFLLGLASVALLLLFLTGIPALVLGLRGLRAVHASDGRLRGVRLAITGMILGGLGTLVSFLGVAAIAVLHLQDRSRRVECVEHLRQIGISLNKYADTHERFPAATWTPPRAVPARRHSWLADLLPLLGEGKGSRARYERLASLIDPARAWDDPENATAAATGVAVFRCPASADGNRAHTQYVGLAGIGIDAASLPRSDPRAGIFGHDRGVKRDEVTAGLSHTLMVLETAQDNGPWLAGGEPTVRGLAADEERYSGPGRAFGGLHAGRIQVLYADGSARVMTDETPPEVFRAQATLRRGR